MIHWTNYIVLEESAWGMIQTTNRWYYHFTGLQKQNIRERHAAPSMTKKQQYDAYLIW